MSNVSKAYEIAKEVYAGIGVDTDQALEKLKSIKISLNCWQGDDLNGFFVSGTIAKRRYSGNRQLSGKSQELRRIAAGCGKGSVNDSRQS